MTVEQFIATWHGVRLNEPELQRAHFRDLCDALGVPRPDPTDAPDATYCFERGAAELGGGSGWASVWYHDHFAWDYPGPGVTRWYLNQFREQRRSRRRGFKAVHWYLRQHQERRGATPLLVACDGRRVVIRTDFTGYFGQTHTITLADLVQPEIAATLRNLWLDPEAFRPRFTIKELSQRHPDIFWMRISHVAWEGRRCYVRFNAITVLCGPGVDARLVADDPATAVTDGPVSHARLVSLHVRDDVPLGTPVTIVAFCYLFRNEAGQVLATFPTMVGGERASQG